MKKEEGGEEHPQSGKKNFLQREDRKFFSFKKKKGTAETLG